MNKNNRWIVLPLVFLTLGLVLPMFSASAKSDESSYQQESKNRQGKKNNKSGSGKNKDDWNKQEYSGEHSEKDIRMAVGSKAFSWLSGSPADNEKLSVGKTAQFFGFVAVRYQSGRVAQRGTLGRSFYQIATPVQRQIIRRAVLAEEPVMAEWWQVRSQLMRKLEDHLYTGEALDEEKLLTIGEEFGYLNAESGRIEAQAFAELERTLTPEQWHQLRLWRENPELVAASKASRPDVGLSREQSAQYEDLFAKAFTLLTGTFADRQIIPLGQPAQLFGFVSIRHKSGHGASRGKISQQFYSLLNNQQTAYLATATQQLIPVTHTFMAERTRLLQEMDRMRQSAIDGGETFDLQRFNKLARNLGILETRCAMIEARAYRQIRVSMSESQMAKLMAMRADYLLDERNMENTSVAQRGEKLYLLCQGCHDSKLAPSLKGIYGRKVADLNSYDYSIAMREQRGRQWDSQALDNFLENPRKAVPGTKMEFAGLLNPQDRQALIAFLQHE